MKKCNAKITSCSQPAVMCDAQCNYCTSCYREAVDVLRESGLEWVARMAFRSLEEEEGVCTPDDKE